MIPVRALPITARAFFLLALTGCTTLPTAPCSSIAQPNTRFACSQLPNCKYNCAVTVINTEGGTAPATITTDVTQQRSGFSAGAHDVSTTPKP